MEQRWTERIPMALVYPSLGLVRGKSKDIGLDGMFVETGYCAGCRYPVIGYFCLASGQK